jgi:hypothetical protein
MPLVSGLVGGARRIDRPGVGWGVITGGFITGYTLNDGWAVRMLLISPFVVDYAGNLVRFAALLPAALRDRERFATEARQYAWSAIGVGTPAPLAYISCCSRCGSRRSATWRRRGNSQRWSAPISARACCAGGNPVAPRRRRVHRRRHRLSCARALPTAAAARPRASIDPPCRDSSHRSGASIPRSRT